MKRFRIVDVVLEIITGISFLASFGLAAYGVKILPKQIPTHYDLHGNVDGYGSPGVLFLLPIIMFLTTLLMSLMVHFLPMKYWNMPFKVNPSRAIAVYAEMITMIVALELENGIFTLLSTVSSVYEKGGSILPALLYIAVMTVTIVWFCISAKRKNG